MFSISIPLFASAIAGSMCLPELGCTWADAGEGVVGGSEGTSTGRVGRAGGAAFPWLLLLLLLLLLSISVKDDGGVSRSKSYTCKFVCWKHRNSW